MCLILFMCKTQLWFKTLLLSIIFQCHKKCVLWKKSHVNSLFFTANWILSQYPLFYLIMSPFVISFLLLSYLNFEITIYRNQRSDPVVGILCQNGKNVWKNRPYHFWRKVRQDLPRLSRSKRNTVPSKVPSQKRLLQGFLICKATFLTLSDLWPFFQNGTLPDQLHSVFLGTQCIKK